MKLNGIHHITAIASNAQKNLDFYVGVLGLRLVKNTVNFDSPDMYHFYYGDYDGNPGSLLTFFIIPEARIGSEGAGAFSSMSLSIASSSIDFWILRLEAMDIPNKVSTTASGHRIIEFKDLDGLRINLVADDDDTRKGFEVEGISRDKAIKGAHSVELKTPDKNSTLEFLGKHFGFQQNADTNLYSVTNKPGDLIEIESNHNLMPAKGGAGTIHHVAFRVSDRETQDYFRNLLLDLNHHVSPVMDRKYFESIYFREPGGALFEIATDAPGMSVDEPLEKLGQSLVLPEWYEDRRSEIERQLPEIDLNIKTN